ncbi:hypothetical protein [Granulosicoccus antarcticus]|uniref:hypothetical protein n=1 Tax=Granulosicoccus antarcticus TaxID=437505 RepID=UPI0012FE441C|nr:hypothetical protein [Granulosicoccus antarcticus]
MQAQPWQLTRRSADVVASMLVNSSAFPSRCAISALVWAVAAQEQGRVQLMTRIVGITEFRFKQAATVIGIFDYGLPLLDD